MANAGLQHIGGSEFAGAEEAALGLLPAGDPGGFDMVYSQKAPRKSCLTPVARLVPDLAVLVLLACAVGWCWVSTWLLMSTGARELTWNVTSYQLGPLTGVCLVAGLKIYLLRPLEDELSHFQAENSRFKDSIGQLHVVAGSLKAKADHFRDANEELQHSITELQNVRGVIEMYAVKTSGDVGDLLEEVKSSVYDQLEIQQRTKRTQQRIRGLIDILLQTILVNGAHGVPGTSRACSEDLEDIMAMLEGSDSASGQDLAQSLNGLRDRADAERSTSQFTRSIVAKLAQLDKDEDGEPGARGARHAGSPPREAEKAGAGAAPSSWLWPGSGSPERPGPGSPDRLGTPGSSKASAGAAPSRPPRSQGQGPASPGSPPQGQRLSTPGSAKGGWDSPARVPQSPPRSGGSLTAHRGSPGGTRAAAGAAPSADSPWRHAELSRDDVSQSSRSSDRSGRGPRISFGRGEVGTYFGDTRSPPSLPHSPSLPRLPEDPPPGGAGSPNRAWQSRPPARGEP